MTGKGPSKFGIITSCYGRGLPVEDAVLRLHKIGFRDLELPCWHLTEGHDAGSYLKGDLSPRLKALRDRISDLGMTVRQFHSTHALRAESESARAEAADWIRRTIEVAEEAGARALILHIGGKKANCADRTDREIFDANAKTLSELADFVKPLKIRLAIENLMTDVNRQGCRIAELKELIETVGSDRIGICLDTGHANVDGLDVPDAIRECGPLLCATHIQETCPGNDLHVFPFTLRRSKSTMDWFRIFRTFQETGYPFPLIGECSNNTGELPLPMVEEYLKTQRFLIESVLQHQFEAPEG